MSNAHRFKKSFQKKFTRENAFLFPVDNRKRFFTFLLRFFLFLFQAGSLSMGRCVATTLAVFAAFNERNARNKIR